MSCFMKTMILRFPKKINPPLFCYPISISHNEWLPSEEFKEMENIKTRYQLDKIGLRRIIKAINHHPYEVTEAEEKDISTLVKNKWGENTIDME